MSTKLYKLTDGIDDYETRIMTPEEVSRADAVAKESTDGSVWWQEVKGDADDSTLQSIPDFMAGRGLQDFTRDRLKPIEARVPLMGQEVQGRWHCDDGRVLSLQHVRWTPCNMLAELPSRAVLAVEYETLADLCDRGRITLERVRHDRCPACAGSGLISHLQLCPICKGSGEVSS